MNREQLLHEFVLVSIILSLLIGCREQAAFLPSVGQEAKLASAAMQTREAAEMLPEPAGEGQEVSAKIFFEKTVHDLGELALGEKGECEFRFKNAGDATLRIGQISRTCGCTIARLARSEYEPGEEGVIRVNYSGQNRPGRVAKSIFVPSNDGKDSKVKLTIKAEVVQYVQVTPPSFKAA